MYEEQEKYEKAKELYEKSLKIREYVLGEKHPDTATSYNNLACLYYSQKKYQIALDYLFRACKIFMEKFGLNYSNTQLAYRNMKMIYTNWNPKGIFEEWLEGKMREVD